MYIKPVAAQGSLKDIHEAELDKIELNQIWTELKKKCDV